MLLLAAMAQRLSRAKLWLAAWQLHMLRSLALRLQILLCRVTRAPLLPRTVVAASAVLSGRPVTLLPCAWQSSRLRKLELEIPFPHRLPVLHLLHAACFVWCLA